jgi:coniferyl-aldehyde dehydrogenase
MSNPKAEPDLTEVFATLHAAARADPSPDAKARRDRLNRLRRMVVDNEAALIAAVSADFGHRAPWETRILEIAPLLSSLRLAERNLHRWMRPRRRAVEIALRPARSEVRYQPLGVIGIVAPWNYPLQLTLSPLIDAFAAGNRAMIKPSDLSPAFGALLADLAAQHFAPEELAVVNGGPEVAAAFSRLPFDHLFFTGSGRVARLVMAAAAENLTPVTLELGGKSPAVLCADFPTDRAARSVAFGKFANAGQTCVAPDYMLVPKGQAKAFAEAVLALAPDATDTTTIVSDRQYARLAGAIDAARDGGATILQKGASDVAARRLAPTLVLDPPAGSALMADEIFGPILPVLTYDSLDEVTARLAEGDRPLALYVFTHDRRIRDRLLDGTLSGGVTVNGTLVHVGQANLPFGGVGASGTGQYHGRDGFLRLSHQRAVHHVGPFSVAERLGPPYGRLARLAYGYLTRGTRGGR